MADRRHQGPAGRARSAAVVNTPRLFANAAGAVNGLQNAVSTPQHPCATATPRPAARAPTPRRAAQTWSPTPITDACHDITVYEALDLAAGACEGNGLLIDISDPANPKRIDAVADPLFAYWHGATFSNDGKAVVFTDEWGGGSAARCRATDQLSWGADAIYEIVDRKLVFRSYYKLPVAQSTTENCVSHVGNLIPVPGRNVLVQAWYQGGVSVMDFTDLSQAEGDRVLRPRPGQRRAVHRPAASGRRTGTTAASTARRSRAASTRSRWRRPPTCRRARSPRRSGVRAARLNAQSQDPITIWTSAPVHGAGRRHRAGDAVADARARRRSFGAFTPGVARTYEASTTATVTSTAGDAHAERGRPEPAEHRAIS